MGRYKKLGGTAHECPSGLRASVPVDMWKSPTMKYRRDKVALRTTASKVSNLRLSK